jgi:hypothetical protein
MTLCPISMLSRILLTDSAATANGHAGGR